MLVCKSPFYNSQFTYTAVSVLAFSTTASLLLCLCWHSLQQPVYCCVCAGILYNSQFTAVSVLAFSTTASLLLCLCWHSLQQPVYCCVCAGILYNSQFTAVSVLAFSTTASLLLCLCWHSLQQPVYCCVCAGILYVLAFSTTATRPRELYTVCRNPEGPGLWRPECSEGASRGLRILQTVDPRSRCSTHLEHMATNLDNDNINNSSFKFSTGGSWR